MSFALAWWARCIPMTSSSTPLHKQPHPFTRSLRHSRPRCISSHLPLMEARWNSNRALARCTLFPPTVPYTRS
ncbi:hypothetical protein BC826DRAFT_986699 [Russula brevipes]|nr:hypothetical protein BC826DRAFT_986699 [Russula brevipes]